jgi:hypothetical protein
VGATEESGPELQISNVLAGQCELLFSLGRGFEESAKLVQEMAGQWNHEQSVIQSSYE